jgi:hypothetical protein
MKPGTWIGLKVILTKRMNRQKLLHLKNITLRKCKLTGNYVSVVLANIIDAYLGFSSLVFFLRHRTFSVHGCLYFPFLNLFKMIFNA